MWLWSTIIFFVLFWCMLSIGSIIWDYRYRVYFFIYTRWKVWLWYPKLCKAKKNFFLFSLINESVSLLLCNSFCCLTITAYLFGSCQSNIDRFAWFNQGCCRYTFVLIAIDSKLKLWFWCYIFFIYWISNCKYFLLTEGQPESIVQDIENMVRSFIEKVMQSFFSPSIHRLEVFHCTYSLFMQLEYYLRTMESSESETASDAVMSFLSSNLIIMPA